MASLFTPLKVGSVVLRNRVGMSALTRNRAPGTIPSDLMAEYYVQRAAGGVGLIVSEGTLVSRQGFVKSLGLIEALCNIYIFCPARSGPMPPASGTKIKLRDGRKSQMPCMPPVLIFMPRSVLAFTYLSICIDGLHNCKLWHGT